MKKITLKISILILAIIMCVSATGCNLFRSGKGSKENLPSSAVSANNVVFNTTPNSDMLTRIEAIEKVKRSVVAIAIENSAGTAMGSGVIVDMNKVDDYGNVLDDQYTFYIMTCHHVIEDLGVITVYIPDMEGDNYGEDDYNSNFTFTGRIGAEKYNTEITLVGGDATSDVALLKLNIKGSGITKDNLVKASFPTSTYSPRIGEDVFAIGNPTGLLPGTVSCGTISYINRSANVSEIGEMTLLQLDIDTYHGSSGGALFNLYGQLIGITNAGSDEYVGINYAIPFIIESSNGYNDNGFYSIASQLLATVTEDNYGYVSGRNENYGYSYTVASTENGDSLVVSAVTIGSKSARAGMKRGDIIYKVAKSAEKEVIDSASEITSQAQFKEFMQSLRIGETFTIRVKRLANMYTYVDRDITMTVEQYIFCDTGIYPEVKPNA